MFYNCKLVGRFATLLCRVLMFLEFGVLQIISMHPILPDGLRPFNLDSRRILVGYQSRTVHGFSTHWTLRINSVIPDGSPQTWDFCRLIK